VAARSSRRSGAPSPSPRAGSSSGPPLDGPLASVEVSGRAAASFGAESATIREAPARVALRF